MFAPQESRDIAAALNTFPADQHQWELRNAATAEDAKPAPSIRNLPSELQLAVAALQGDDGLIAPTTEDTP